MNKHQAKLRPGTPEARRAYCDCPVQENGIPERDAPAGRYTMVIQGENAYLIDDTCPLHGSDPRHQLPEGI